MSADPITAGIDLVSTFVGKFVKDKDLAAKLLHEANSQEMASEIQARLGQMEVNKIEAASKSLFVSGWRPAVGWICVLSLGYQFFLSPFIRFIAIVVMDNPPNFPVLDSSQLTPILIGMLGLGGLRTYEKVNKVSRN